MEDKSKNKLHGVQDEGRSIDFSSNSANFETNKGILKLPLDSKTFFHTDFTWA